MKNLVILSVMALSLSAGAADLLTLTRNSGFSPVPGESKTSINENGKIVRVKRIRAAVTKENLGQLSAAALQTLKDKIEEIDDNAKVIDPKPNAPRCMDAPSSSVAINKGGKVITLRESYSCHTAVVQGSKAAALISTIEKLDSK